MLMLQRERPLWSRLKVNWKPTRLTRQRLKDVGTSKGEIINIEGFPRISGVIDGDGYLTTIAGLVRV